MLRRVEEELRKPTYLPLENRRLIAKKISEHIENNYPRVMLALLFGSFTDPRRYFRDLDLGIHTLWSLPVEKADSLALELQWDLEELLEKEFSLPKKVDVIVLDYAPHYIRVEAVKGWLLVEREKGLWALVAKWAHTDEEDHLIKTKLAHQLLRGKVEHKGNEVGDQSSKQ